MEITQLIQTIERLQDDVQGISLSAVEKDILLKKVAALYENLLLKTSENAAIQTTFFEEPKTIVEVREAAETEASIVEEEPIAVEEIMELKAEITNVPQQEIQIAENEKTETAPASFSVTDTEIVDIKIEDNNAIKYVSPAAENEAKSHHLLLDAKAEKPLLNERFRQSSGLNERLAKGDLKKLIDFNRQFVFISELFQNDNAAFIKAIEKINETQTLEEAFAYLNSEVIHKYRWKPESESVKLFEKIVRQKFGA